MFAAKPKPAGVAKPVRTIELDQQLMCCRYSHDLRFVFAAGLDGKLHRWEATGAKHDSFDAPGGWIESLELHPKRPELFTADSWGTIRGWSYEGDRVRVKWTVVKAHKTWLRRLALSADGSQLATCGNDCVVRLFSATDGKSLHTLTSHEHHVQSVAFHPDGRHLVSGDLHGVVKQWDIAGGRCVREMRADVLFKKLREYEQGGVRAMTFDTAGKTLYCGGFEGDNPNQAHGKPTVVAFDWQSGKPTATLTPKADFKGPIVDLTFHPAGYLLAAGSSEAGGALWFFKPGESGEKHLVKHPTSFRGLGLHADGKHLAATAFGNRGGQRGGNGRRLNKKGEYVGFGGSLVLYELAAGA